MLKDRESSQFQTTRWTLLGMAATGTEEESDLALEIICQRYWAPLYAYVRRKGQSPEDSKDLVQSFFLRLIDGDWLQRAEVGKGKLRTFLLTLLNRHMASEWRKYYAEKRGGGEMALSLDLELSGDLESDFVEGSAEANFDRQWALSVLEQSLHELQLDYEKRGLSERFQRLKIYLEWREEGAESDPYEEVADQLKMTEGAVKVAVFRLRKQYREMLIKQVKLTLGEQDQVEVELIYLMKALGAGE